MTNLIRNIVGIILVISGILGCAIEGTMIPFLALVLGISLIVTKHEVLKTIFKKQIFIKIIAISMLVLTLTACSQSNDSSTDTTQTETATEQTTQSESTNEETEQVETTEETKASDAQDSADHEKITMSDIPEYSGNIFVHINDGNPSFSDQQKNCTESFESYSDLDDKGRVGVALACLSTDTMPKDEEERDSISSVEPTGWVQAEYDFVSGKYLYNRSHLIGWQLSAENANKKNLITGTKSFNVDGMLPFENMVADYIHETNNHVMYRVTPVFSGDNLLAQGVQIEAWSVEDDGDGICINVFVYNVEDGVTIDYKAGNSSSDGTKGEAQSNASSNGNSSAGSENSVVVPENNGTETGENLVWIPVNGGTKYHSNAGCSNMKNPKQVTKEIAEASGYEPCKKCY